MSVLGENKINALQQIFQKEPESKKETYRWNINWKKVTAVGLVGLTLIAAIFLPLLLNPAYFASHQKLPSLSDGHASVQTKCPMLQFSSDVLPLALPFTSESIEQECQERIFKNEQQRTLQKPSQKEWEAFVSSQLNVHSAMIAKVAINGQANPVDGVHYFTSEETVFELSDFPGTIFKTASPYQHNSKFYAENRHRLSLKAQKICQEEHLDRLRVPRTALVPIKGADGEEIWLVAEEKLPIIGGKFAEFRQHLKLMNGDLRLQTIVDETFAQLLHFIHLTHLSDLKANNIPFLSNGLEICLVDLNVISNPRVGLYEFPQSEHSLIDFLEERNIIWLREFLKQRWPDEWENYDFSRVEKPRLEKLAFKRKMQERKISPSDPIKINDKIFKGLSSFEREIAKDFIQTLNRKLTQGDFYRNEERLILIKIYADLKRFEGMIGDEFACHVRDRVLYERIIPHLREQGVIFGVDDFGGHGIAIYC